MQKKKILLATAFAALLALSCAAVILAEDSSGASDSVTKDGVTVTYSESLDGKGVSLHFSFASDSKIKGDNVFVTINNTDYGRLNLLDVPYIYVEGHPEAISIKLVQVNTVELKLYLTGYAIDVIQVAHGTINSDRNAANQGDTVTLTATPDTGYVLARWIVDSDVTVSGNTFTMPAHDVTVTAEFTPVSTAHSVSILVEGSGSYTVSPSMLVSKGVTVTVTLIPASSDYEFKGWKNISPSTVSPVKADTNVYTFVMPDSNVSMTAEFQLAKPHSYTVNASPAEGGTVSPASGSAAAGTPVQFTVTPKTGYNVKESTITSVPALTFTLTGNVCAFVMPNEDVAITVGFVSLPMYDISVSGTNGTVTSDAPKAYEGQTVRLTLTPASGYVFDKMIVSPSSLDVVPTAKENEYTFVMPASSVTIKASFKIQTDITKTVANGSISVDLDPQVRVDSALSLIIDKGYAKQINIPKDAKAYTVTASVKTDGKSVDLSGRNIVLKLSYAIPQGFTEGDIKVYYVSDDGSIVLRQVSSYENGYVVIDYVDGSKLSASTYAVSTEMILPVATDTIGVRDGANGYVEIKIGGDVSKSTTLDLSIKKVSPSLKNIPAGALTYDVSLTAKNGSSKVDLSQNEVVLYLDAGDKSASKNLYVYYVSGDGKTVEKISAGLTEDNDVRLVVTHFSMYVISNTEIQPLEDDSTMFIIGGIAALIVVLLVAVVLISKRKTKEC